MSEFDDVRWRQRFDSFQRALATLERTVAHMQGPEPTETEQLAIIQCLEFTHGLAWSVFKDFLEAQGMTDLFASRRSTQAAIDRGLVIDGETWMEMIKSRNRTSHAHDEGEAAAIAAKVLGSYLRLFRQLRDRLAPIALEEPRR